MKVLVAAIAAGAAAGWALAAAAQDPGAKDLFFGDDKAALQAQPTGFRPAPPATGIARGGTAASQAVADKPVQPAPPVASSHPGLRVWLSDAADASGGRKLSPQQTFRTGDKFKLWMQANRDGYLYIVNVGTSGATRVMFPRANQDNRVARFKDFSISSPLVFSQPAGTEQLVVVLAAAPMDDAAVPLSSGGSMKVSLRPGASQPAQPAQATQAGAAKDPTSASLDLALADLRGSKDLKFEDDGAELVAVNRRSDERAGAFAPVVVNLKLSHR